MLNGCEDHWTLQDRGAVPQLYQMTVCVHIRVVVPGAWVAFSYSPVSAPAPDLGLEGDEGAVYGWLLRVRHRFPVPLTPAQWHRVCLRMDAYGNSFSLEVKQAELKSALEVKCYLDRKWTACDDYLLLTSDFPFTSSGV